MTYSYPAYYIMLQWNISAFLAHHSYLLSATAIVFFGWLSFVQGKASCENTQSSLSSVRVLWAVKHAKTCSE